MERWTRWQDWVAAAAGLVASVVSIWMAPQSAVGMYLMLVPGVLMIAAAVWSLAAPGLVSMEWIIAAIGVLLMLSPWIGGFTGETGTAWTAWISGAVGLIAGVWAVAPAERAHDQAESGRRSAHA
jgi:uncharacterized membrane protein